MLYQVDLDLKSHDEDSVSKLAITVDDEGVEKLIDWKTVSDFWPNQPPFDRLDIFIKLLPSGE